MVSEFFTTLNSSLREYEPYRQAVRAIRRGEDSLSLEQLPGALLATIITLLGYDTKRPVIYVTPTIEDGKALCRDLESLLDSTIPLLSGHAGDLGVLLNSVQGEEYPPVVITYEGLVTPVPAFEQWKESSLSFQIGQDIRIDEVAQSLTDMGYLRVPRVSMEGEFALRGEVLDIAVPQGNPVRIIFEWDQIESIRYFSLENQSSCGEVTHVDLYALQFDGDQKGSLCEYFPKNLLLCRKGGEGYQRIQDLLDVREAVHWTPYEDAIPQGCTVIDIPQIHGQTPDAIAIKGNDGRAFFGNIPYVQEEITSLHQAGYSIAIASASDAQMKRIQHILGDHEQLSYISTGFSGGFSLPGLQLALICEDEIFGKKTLRKHGRKAESKPLETFLDLEPGDYVVHVQYGIGKFHDIERITSLGNERDFIKIEYQDKEYIFVPLEQVNLVQRYVGRHSGVQLDRIGSKSWSKRKAYVKKKAEELADRLVKLYARRQAARGFAFPPDTQWQDAFEAAFPYEETEDQIRCINEVKSDMESPRPMDRLLCGDVGFGKTEVAIRAAFKAVNSGKQVAILAPTTILAEQHFETLQERMKDYPINLAMVSRLVSRKDLRITLQAVAQGDVDILVGTHRLIQKDVAWKQLGLLVVDEEQRFGVKDKERLKEIKVGVDCLSMSATPIPRTLHMTLLKIRDISLLTTAPSVRRPVETHIEPYDGEIVTRAIRNEVNRGGQVFYLHNRIESLREVEMSLVKMLPELRIVSVHGQMDPKELEDKMHRFIRQDFHVLVATTLIENGIDIPNANTIIIDRADMYGVSQLYQLRGRVGRADKLAYAYLLYPDQRALSELAMKRLSIISDNTELGSGFSIAMKDLEVRGAGNLLGREQSGEIYAVGIDLFLALLEEAVGDIQGEEREIPPLLDLEYSGFIPDSYIDQSSTKMEVYKKIASIESYEDYQREIEVITDRFGPIPDEVSSLFSLAEIRIICKKLSILSLRERRGLVSVEFGKVSLVPVESVMRLIRESNGRVKPDPAKPNVIRMETGTIGLREKAEFIRDTLQRIIQ